MEAQAKERIRGAMSSGKVGFWNLQLSIRDADRLLGEDGMVEQREFERRQAEREISYQSQHNKSRNYEHGR